LRGFASGEPVLVSHSLPTGIGYPPKPCPLRPAPLQLYFTCRHHLLPSLSTLGRLCRPLCSDCSDPSTSLAAVTPVGGMMDPRPQLILQVHVDQVRIVLNMASPTTHQLLPAECDRHVHVLCMFPERDQKTPFPIHIEWWGEVESSHQGPHGPTHLQCAPAPYGTISPSG